jgi:hypothetical protein
VSQEAMSKRLGLVYVIVTAATATATTINIIHHNHREPFPKTDF